MNSLNPHLLLFIGVMTWVGLPMIALVAGSLLWQRKAPFWRRLWQTSAVVSVCAALFVWLQWFHNPLPTDEFLIQNFHEHRAEFEQLVQGQRNYRGDTSKPPYHYSNTPEAQALLKKVGMGQMQVGNGMWYPDAYSARAAKLQGEYYGHSYKGIKHTPQESIDYWRTNLPEMFEGVAPVTNRLQLDYLRGQFHFKRFYGYFSLDTGMTDGYFLLNAFRLAQTSGFKGFGKSYVYFPYPPRDEGGYLLLPGYDMQDKPGVGKGYRLFDSLNGYPPNWMDGECVARRIQPQWFIFMCKDA